MQFSPSDIDLINSSLKIPNLGFSAWRSFSSAMGTPVYFSTTGKLPFPLRSNFPYYLAPATGGGYHLYPETSSTDWSATPGALPEETVLPGQNFAQGANRVRLTSQGTGTHTITTVPLVSLLRDLSGNGFDVYPVGFDQTNKHAFIERPTDGQGRTYLRSRLFARDQSASTYNIYGKTFPQGPKTAKFRARQACVGARVVWQTFVCEVKTSDTRSLHKVRLGPTAMNLSTGVITKSQHGFQTGAKVRVLPSPALLGPAGLATGVDYFVRAYSSSSFTLHTTSLEAFDGLNPIVSASSAQGDYWLYAPDRPGDIERMRFFIELLDPASGGNALSPRTGGESSKLAVTLTIASDFTISGVANGEIGVAGRSLNGLGNLGKVRLWFPQGARGPKRLDTLLPLQSGDYYITLTPGSSTKARLHDTLTSAKASVGVATSASSCIKFSAAGSGFVRAEPADGRSAITIGAAPNVEVKPSFRMPLGQLGVVTFIIDYDDPSAAGIVSEIHLNGQLRERTVTAGTKGPLRLAVNDGTPAWTLFNSAAAHVTFEGHLYAAYLGASTKSSSEVLTSEITPLSQTLMSQYGLV